MDAGYRKSWNRLRVKKTMKEYDSVKGGGTIRIDWRLSLWSALEITERLRTRKSSSKC
jgi:hypothetical protein